VLGDLWNEAIENWGFVSNVLAELIGAVVLGGLLALALRIWTDRQRRTPKSLAVHRLQSFGLHVIEQSSAILGYGFPAERGDWSWASAVEHLLPFLEVDTEANDRRETVALKDWIWLARVVVREFDRLDARLAPYGFVLTDSRRLYDRFAILDQDVEAVRATLEVLDDKERAVPALRQTLEKLLPRQILPCIISSVVLVGVTQEIKKQPFSNDAVATRSIGDYASFMEPRYQAHMRRQRKKDRLSRRPQTEC